MAEIYFKLLSYDVWCSVENSTPKRSDSFQDRLGHMFKRLAETRGKPCWENLGRVFPKHDRNLTALVSTSIEFNSVNRDRIRQHHPATLYFLQFHFSSLNSHALSLYLISLRSIKYFDHPQLSQGKTLGTKHFSQPKDQNFGIFCHRLSRKTLC